MKLNSREKVVTLLLSLLPDQSYKVSTVKFEFPQKVVTLVLSLLPDKSYKVSTVKFEFPQKVVTLLLSLLPDQSYKVSTVKFEFPQKVVTLLLSLPPYQSYKVSTILFIDKGTDENLRLFKEIISTAILPVAGYFTILSQGCHPVGKNGDPRERPHDHQGPVDRN